jgi:hypothetical protein
MKHSVRLETVAAVVLVLSVASVSFADTPYFPLEVGMEWKYEESLYWSPTGDTVVVRVTGTEEIDGREYYVIENFFFPHCPHAEHRVRVDGGKIWMRGPNKEKILYDFETFPWCMGSFPHENPLVLSSGDTCYTGCRDGCPDGSTYMQTSPTSFRIEICYMGYDYWWTDEFREGVGLIGRSWGYYMYWPELYDYYYDLVSFTDPTSVENMSWGEVKALFRE